MKKYQIIYADPPWSYNDKMANHSFSLDHEYQTQSKDWIAKLPIKNITENDCVLFMWATSPLLPEALEVMKSWGFKYKTLAFCWIKKTKNGKQVHNLGRWTMGGVELCLLGTKGHPKRKVKNIKQTFEALRTKHSQKPFEVRKFINDLMGNDCTKIELFARQKTEGWDVWGNEVENSIELSTTAHLTARKITDKMTA
ncbi:MAG: DNA methyltransferase [Thaumarchaeota archaeon]|nr:DNA methyltransferase [Nitrososphaerota archaeon]